MTILISKPKTIDKLFALQSALRDPDLATGTDASVLSVLIEFQNPNNGYSWPSIETISKVAGIKERATRMSVRRLEAAGYIKTSRGGGRKMTSRYRVCLERFSEAPPLREHIMRAMNKRHEDAVFSETNTRHEEAETRHGDDSKPGTTVPPKPSYTNHLTKNPSVPTASAIGPTRDRAEQVQTYVEELRKCETALKVIRERGIAVRGEEAIVSYRYLLDIAEENGGYGIGDPIAGWAHRLSEDLMDLMDEETSERAAA